MEIKKYSTWDFASTFFKNVRFDSASLKMFLNRYSSTATLVKVFLAIYNLEILNKLVDTSVVVSGTQLINELHPSACNFETSKYLEMYMFEFGILSEAGLIVCFRLPNKKCSYGNTEVFMLSEKAVNLVNGKTEEEIVALVFNIICGEGIDKELTSVELGSYN